MTNIVAVIAFTITTNWTTTGILSPPPKPAQSVSTLEYRPTYEIQSGTVTSNVVAKFIWKGTTNIYVIESIPIQTGLQRSIALSPVLGE
jgi:hypothetical protein